MSGSIARFRLSLAYPNNRSATTTTSARVAIVPGVVGNGGEIIAIRPLAFDGHHAFQEVPAPFDGQGSLCIDGLGNVLLVRSLHVIDERSVAQRDQTPVRFDAFVGLDTLDWHGQDEVDGIACLPAAPDFDVTVAHLARDGRAVDRE